MTGSCPIVVNKIEWYFRIRETNSTAGDYKSEGNFLGCGAHAEYEADELLEDNMNYDM